MATQSELEALKNSLLASGQPITASIHRNWAQQIINEFYNATSRGKVLATTSTVGSLSSGDKIYIIRGTDAKLISKDAFGSSMERWDFSAHSNAFPTDPFKIYIVKSESVYGIADGTLMYSVGNTLPTTPTIADFYLK
jgi:hypothetical protein